MILTEIHENRYEINTPVTKIAFFFRKTGQKSFQEPDY